MATIIVRNLGPNYDPLFGGTGQQNFLADLDAVAQIIMTRLRLLQGEWWSDLADGLPLFQRILGQAPNIQQVGLLINQRIAGSPFVTGITNISISFNQSTLTFSYSATVQTQFGTVTVTNNNPTPPTQSLPD